MAAPLPISATTTAPSFPVSNASPPPTTAIVSPSHTSAYFTITIPLETDVLRDSEDHAEISMFDNYIVVYKFIQDLQFFVTGGDDENELILATVLQAFIDAVSLLLRSNLDRMGALENVDLILLCVDEIVDGGMILETDGIVIAGKVATHSIDDGAPLAEQTISQALATARDHLARSLLR